MTEQEYNELRETSWRRPLDAAEDARVQAYLALNPDAQRAWEQDAELTQLLAQLPPAPLSSNFTSQVLGALDRELRTAPSVRTRWRWHHLLPRLAWAMALLLLVGFSVQKYRGYRQEKLVHELVQATFNHRLAPNIFQDYDVIRSLGQLPPPADEELWLVLSQTTVR